MTIQAEIAISSQYYASKLSDFTNLPAASIKKAYEGQYGYLKMHFYRANALKGTGHLAEGFCGFSTVTTALSIFGLNPAAIPPAIPPCLAAASFLTILAASYGRDRVKETVINTVKQAGLTPAR